jgi:glycosyltransferase involved in cell wall biosynthesis
MTLHVSIIICTRNRADSLRETLASLSRCEIPADVVAELVVIDNGSTDHTQAIVRAARLPLLPVRYIEEPKVGLSHCRNRGLTASAGDILLFTDDDVRVPPGWIEGMCRPIASREADAVAGGVRLAPYLERPWLRGFMRTLIASTDALIAAHEVQLIGANMAFGRHVLEKVPAFDPELGAGALGFGEEALYSAQIERAGFKLVARWDVAVEHHCSDERLNRDGLVPIAQRMGRSRAYLRYHWEHRNVLAPRLAELWVRLKLMLRRGFDVLVSGGGEPRAWEVAYITHVHLYRHYRSETSRPRNYGRHGLVKRYDSMDVASSHGG